MEHSNVEIIIIKAEPETQEEVECDFPSEEIMIEPLNVKKECSEHFESIEQKSGATLREENTIQRKRAGKISKSPKNFSCSECHLKLSSKTSLTAHMQTHTGEKPLSFLKMAGKYLTEEETDGVDSDVEFENNDDITDTEDFVENQVDPNITDSESSESDADNFIDILESATTSESACEVREDNAEHVMYKSESGFEWCSAPPSCPRSRVHNISTVRSGLQGASSNVTSIADMFYLFIGKEIAEEICLQTNRFCQNSQKPEATIPPITVDEMYAFIGILLSSGKNRGRKLQLSELWTSESLFRQQYFTAAMSKNRFINIFSNIRFDDRSTRQNRFQESGDKLEAIKSIFDKFVKSCNTLYSPGSNLSVDERLATHRGNCPFRVYMKSKPGRYGIKILSVSDSMNAYVLDVQVYTGMVNGKRDLDQGYRVVNDLVQPYYGSNRGVTTDSVFTSVPLAECLLGKGLSLTGTLRKNNKDIPPVFLADELRATYSSTFGFTDKMTLVSYVPKVNNAVILLSTKFINTNVSTMEEKKPEILQHYDKTKIGEKMTGEFSCVRPTRRWPFRLFMEIIDIAALNAYVLWVEKYPEWQKQSRRSRRKIFIRTLSIELAKCNVETRKNIGVGFHKPQQEAFDSFLSSPLLEAATTSQKIFKTGCCRFCTTRRRTRMCCSVCKRPICQAHRYQQKTTVCLKCRDSDFLE